MPEFRVRIDATESFSELALIQFMKDKTDAFVLVHHTPLSDNLHYHAYVQTKHTQGNFSNYIKKILGVIGSDYSNKTCLSDRRHEYLSYLFNTKKGNVSRFVCSEGVSEYDIVQARDNAVRVEKEFLARVKATKKTKFDIAEMVSQGTWSSLEELYDIVCSSLCAQRMCCAPFVVKDVMSTAIVLSDKRKLKDEVKESVINSFRR